MDTQQPAQPKMKFPHRHLISALLTLALIILGTVAVILYGMGYRLGFNTGTPKIAHTGILNASSSPRGALVYVDGHPTSATNNTVNLAPGKYTISMSKEGYQNWQKDVVIKEQLVTNADALLIPSAPTLQSISTVGINSPVLDPSGSKLAFTVASQSAKTNGIYVLDMSSHVFPVFPIQSSSTQIVDDTLDSFSQAKLTWSPDGQQLLASISGQLHSPTTYLLNAQGMNDAPTDVTATLPTLENDWSNQKADKDRLRLQSLQAKVRTLLEKDFNVIAWSPDDTKVLYQAAQDTTLPVIIQPRRIGNNMLYEVRTIKKGGIYVYNITEDVNTKILDTSPASLPSASCAITNADCISPISWFPDSEHLLYVHDHKINLVETDGSNMTTVYAGPFRGQYVYPWPDGTKLVIVTNLDNTNIPPTFYTISLQ